MKSWDHLAKNDMAESVSRDLAEQMFAGMFASFRKILPDLSLELEEQIRKRCEVVRFKKEAIILDFDEVCRHCFFAVSGMVKSVRNNRKVEEEDLPDKKGKGKKKKKAGNKERIGWFMGAGDVMIAVRSFYRQTPSKERLIAMQDTECIALRHDDLEWIYQTFIEFNIVGRKLTEKYYDPCYERASWMGLTAAEKYVELLEEYPDLMMKVPNVAIAAFLGIAEATLSRIITEVNNSKKKNSNKKNKKS